jgi:hypothetical protein
VVPILTWLIEGAVGPALVGMPVTWAASDLMGSARQWFRRLRRADDLGRIIRAAVGRDLRLSDAEFAAIRQLLGQESTWIDAGLSTVEELASVIALCLPGRAGDSLVAGRAIAAGLLDFAVRDLEPEWFQQMLFARLDRLQADQASALDKALLCVHADLAALVACQETANTIRFAQVMSQLERVLDLLPPGPADRGEVAVYLATLIQWLNADPWPQDTRFAGPTLTPAAIERKMTIAGSHRGRGQVLEAADDAASRCTRLVVLGGPGAGKTWLAKRTARLCAEAALEALAAAAELDEVELPLYTTCARLSAAPPGDGIRRAVVASALGQLPDLGGSRILHALQVSFEERNDRTLLVADSMDEARGADDRIRQADTLPASWRIMLTSRPVAWNRQLTIDEGDAAQQVGTLQPLRYPEDVDALILGWFKSRLEWAASLSAQLRDRPALQEGATVPLILAFYCIVGGGQPLPARRADLYAKVIRRMLTGLWRGSGDRDLDADECMDTLRDWAWSAAARDAVSGVGAWEDEFPAPRVRHSRDERDALDHVAVPLAPPDPDTGKSQRRFVHRSLREHLVAEHVALRMPAKDAAEELLQHLWYDTDWEYTAPVALAMHPQRHQVLAMLVCRVTGADQLPADLAAIDGCWEIRRFLARVAQESSEGDWSPEGRRLIEKARLDLAASPRGRLHLLVASDWPASNRLIFESLLGLLGKGADRLTAAWLEELLARLAATEGDRGRVRDALSAFTAEAGWDVARRAIRLAAARAHRARLPESTGPSPLSAPAWGLAARERSRAVEHLLGILAAETDAGRALRIASGLAWLAPTVEERAEAVVPLLRLLAAETDPWKALMLVDGLVWLDPAADERAQAREALLRLLTAQVDVGVVDRLAPAVVRLAVTEQEKTQAKDALLRLLAVQADGSAAAGAAAAIALLKPTVSDLLGSGNWLCPPTPPLLAAARRNTTLPAWIAALPLLRDSVRW